MEITVYPKNKYDFDSDIGIYNIEGDIDHHKIGDIPTVTVKTGNYSWIEFTKYEWPEIKDAIDDYFNSLEKEV